MTTPIQFSSQEAFEQAVGTFLKEKLSFAVSSRMETVGRGRCLPLVEIKTYEVEVQLNGETITSFWLE